MAEIFCKVYHIPQKEERHIWSLRHIVFHATPRRTCKTHTLKVLHENCMRINNCTHKKKKRKPVVRVAMQCTYRHASCIANAYKMTGIYDTAHMYFTKATMHMPPKASPHIVCTRIAFGYGCGGQSAFELRDCPFDMFRAWSTCVGGVLFS